MNADFQIFLYRLLRFRDIDREHDQPFAGEFFVDFLDERFFIAAVRAPSGPELQQDNFALH